MKQSTKIAGGIAGAGAAISLVLGIFSLDGRYMKDAYADDYHLQEAVDRESADVDTQIKIIVLEIQFWSSLDSLTATERSRLEIAKLQLAALLERQGDLAQPK